MSTNVVVPNKTSSIYVENKRLIAAPPPLPMANTFFIIKSGWRLRKRSRVTKGYEHLTTLNGQHKIHVILQM